MMNQSPPNQRHLTNRRFFRTLLGGDGLCDAGAAYTVPLGRYSRSRLLRQVVWRRSGCGEQKQPRDLPVGSGQIGALI
jgi:hypothetical protein